MCIFVFGSLAFPATLYFSRVAISGLSLPLCIACGAYFGFATFSPLEPLPIVFYTNFRVETLVTVQPLHEG